MKKRIWKRYLFLIIVGLAVYMGERAEGGKELYPESRDLVQAFAMEEQEPDASMLLLQMENENKSSRETQPADGEKGLNVDGGSDKREEQDGSAVQTETLLEQMQAEQMNPQKEDPQISVQTDNGFVPHEKQYEYDWEALKQYKNLISTFYAIDASTASSERQLNLEDLLSKDMTIDKNLGPYQILIYHSHSKEAFIDSRPGETEDTIVGMGERLTELLTEYGYSVLHHTAEYDTLRDDAYAKALPKIEKLLSENPSIQVVIDLHRDAGVEGVNRTTVMDGKEYAKFMLFNGMSYNRKTGNIKYLPNENLAENLAFSFQMQVKAGEYYPGLTRKIYLKAYRYNMHLKPKTLLIELGDSNCTVDQVKNTLEPLAHILHMVISGG